jgi:hydrogenase maturation protease
MRSAHSAVILGMGNPFLTDDAVGCRLARDLKAGLGPSSGVRVVEECSVGGLSLLDLVTGCDLIVALDSIKTAGGVPGDWYSFTADRLCETQNLSNVHDANFSTALELGRRLGHVLPRDEDVHIFAIEILDNLTFSERMTPQLEEPYPRYAAEILGEVRELLIRHGAGVFDERSSDRF